MNNNNAYKRGFTLIELLVVVLIIGILASVALPQYQKAVRKARLSEVASTFSALSKGVDMYLLENGYPTGSAAVQFTGTSKNASLDIDLTCSTEDDYFCYQNVGRWAVKCNSSLCSIIFYDGNTWLNDSSVSWVKRENGAWNNRFEDSGGHIANVCNF